MVLDFSISCSLSRLLKFLADSSFSLWLQNLTLCGCPKALALKDAADLYAPDAVGCLALESLNVLTKYIVAHLECSKWIELAFAEVVPSDLSGDSSAASSELLVTFCKRVEQQLSSV